MRNLRRGQDLGEEAVEDPEDVEEAEAGEDLVVVPSSKQTLSPLLKFEII